jgi:hypothetical protein
MTHALRVKPVHLYSSVGGKWQPMAKKKRATRATQVFIFSGRVGRRRWGPKPPTSKMQFMPLPMLLTLLLASSVNAGRPSTKTTQAPSPDAKVVSTMTPGFIRSCPNILVSSSACGLKPNVRRKPMRDGSYSAISTDSMYERESYALCG